MFKFAAGLAVSAMAVSSALWAGDSMESEKQDYDDRYYFGLLYNYIDADHDERFVEDSQGFKLLLGRQWNRRMALEGFLSFNEFDRRDVPLNQFGFRPTLEQEEISFGLDVLAFTSKCATCLRPFVKAGIGLTSTEDTLGGNEDTTDFNAELGAGLQWKLNDHGLALRGDISHRWLFWGDERGDAEPDEWIGGLGLVYPFGDAPELKTPKACKKDKKRGCCCDGDQDGVTDCKDRCPGTPAGTPVDENGCPAGAAPAAPTATDGDDDGDGVLNSVDKCPNTPPGTKVDVNGCALPETVVIYFAFDSDSLNAAAKGALDRVAKHLGERKYVIAIANGHADATGTEEYNLDLSERRASSVADYLISRGVPADQIRKRAYGETRPAADNDSEMGRAKNRRVEINLLRQ